MNALKKEIIDYYNREIEEDAYRYEDFNLICTDLEAIPLGYTTTDNEDAELEFTLDMVNLVFKKFVDSKLVEEVLLKDEEDAILYIRYLTFGDLTC